MNEQRERLYIQKWRPQARGGWGMAMLNVAAAYRLLGSHRASFRWFERAALAGDGNGRLEVAYCFHYGLGVRRDTARARRAYRTAIASRYITPYGREEAMYHLAVLLYFEGSVSARAEAGRLLRRANAEGDYPQAATMLRQLEQKSTEPICACRRGLVRRIARLRCAVHRHRPRAHAGR